MATVIIRLRRADTCSVCGTALTPSTMAHWDKISKAVTCLDCGVANHDLEATTDVPVETSSVTPELLRPESGRAGASARKVFERRHEKREEVLNERFGRFAGVVKFLVDDPQSTRAWEKGSQGERELADALTRRIGDRTVLLHDRRIPKSSANIDHLAIASSGIWIIDAKKYSGRLESRDKGGWRTIENHVYVAGRDQSKLAAGLHKQEVVVRKALARPDVPIHMALCFIGAEWSLFAKPFQVDGVWVTWGKKLAEMISEPGRLSEVEVLSVANTLAIALPPKDV